MLSLGLIFIPLMQNADITLILSNKVINMMQVFLAVAILVYSIIISTSKYDIRESAGKLKKLTR
jgi:hypothetical protein